MTEVVKVEDFSKMFNRKTFSYYDFCCLEEALDFINLKTLQGVKCHLLKDFDGMAQREIENRNNFKYEEEGLQSFGDVLL